jgi:hypothetical protein
LRHQVKALQFKHLEEKKMKIVRIMLVVLAIVGMSLFVAVRKSTLNAKPSSNSAVVDKVIEKEKAAWEAEKKKDKAAYELLLADDYSQVVMDAALMTRTQALEEFAKEDLQDYSLRDFKTTQVAPSVILLTYKFHVKTVRGGQTHEDNFVASSLWANRFGNWVNVFFQETPTK